MNNKIYIKILDNEIWISKNNKLYKEKTNTILENNFITNYKVLETNLKQIINKYKLTNLIIQNKIYIIINKLYCETNLFILKTIMYNLGLSNYKLLYEEDLYKYIYPNVLSIWKTNGIYIYNNVENYIDINNKNDIKKISTNTLLITSNKDVLNILNKDLILYENDTNPIFDMINNIDD